MDRVASYAAQSDEWIRSVQASLGPPAENLLRRMHEATKLACAKRRSLVPAEVFSRAHQGVCQWTDEQIAEELGKDTVAEAEAALKQAVRCHALLMSASTNTTCKEHIKVPGIIKFYRSILDDAVSRGCYALMADSDLVKVGDWLAQVIRAKALLVVPIAPFVRGPPPPTTAITTSVEEPEKKKKEEEVVTSPVRRISDDEKSEEEEEKSSESEEDEEDQ